MSGISEVIHNGRASVIHQQAINRTVAPAQHCSGVNP